jgi:hypothetical protein
MKYRFIHAALSIIGIPTEAIHIAPALKALATADVV